MVNWHLPELFEEDVYEPDPDVYPGTPEEAQWKGPAQNDRLVVGERKWSPEQWDNLSDEVLPTKAKTENSWKKLRKKVNSANRRARHVAKKSEITLDIPPMEDILGMGLSVSGDLISAHAVYEVEGAEEMGWF